MATDNYFMNNFTIKDNINLKVIKESSTENFTNNEYRDIILKLDKSFNSSINKVNELETIIIEKDIAYEKVHNKNTILTCFSILLIFICIISFIIGYYYANKKHISKYDNL